MHEIDSHSSAKNTLTNTKNQTKMSKERSIGVLIDFMEYMKFFYFCNRANVC